MDINEAIIICKGKIDSTKNDIKYCKDKDLLKILNKKLEYNELIQTTLEYFSKE